MPATPRTIALCVKPLSCPDAKLSKRLIAQMPNCPNSLNGKYLPAPKAKNVYETIRTKRLNAWYRNFKSSIKLVVQEPLGDFAVATLSVLVTALLSLEVMDTTDWSANPCK